MPKPKFASSMLNWCLLSILVVSVSGCVSSGELVKIEPAQGVTQGFILMTPEKPVANLILFAGGHGRLRLTGGPNMTWGSEIFTVRTRGKFVDKGFQVAVIDAPYDKFGYMSINRMSEEHRINVRAVADYMKSKANVPVWLVGTSRGTASVANIAINDPDAYAGAVFTSSLDDVAHEDLSSIPLSTLVVHHRNDGCYVCSPSTAEDIYTKLTGASSRELRWVEGGRSTGDVCGPNSYHGFLGTEQKAVDTIAGFILSKDSK